MTLDEFKYLLYSLVHPAFVQPPSGKEPEFDRITFPRAQLSAICDVKPELREHPFIAYLLYFTTPEVTALVSYYKITILFSSNKDAIFLDKSPIYAHTPRFDEIDLNTWVPCLTHAYDSRIPTLVIHVNSEGTLAALNIRPKGIVDKRIALNEAQAQTTIAWTDQELIYPPRSLNIFNANIPELMLAINSKGVARIGVDPQSIKLDPLLPARILKASSATHDILQAYITWSQELAIALKLQELEHNWKGLELLTPSVFNSLNTVKSLCSEPQYKSTILLTLSAYLLNASLPPKVPNFSGLQKNAKFLSRLENLVTDTRTPIYSKKDLKQLALWQKLNTCATIAAVFPDNILFAWAASSTKGVILARYKGVLSFIPDDSFSDIHHSYTNKRRADFLSQEEFWINFFHLHPCLAPLLAKYIAHD
jgi:hypothetical protein